MIGRPVRPLGTRWAPRAWALLCLAALLCSLAVPHSSQAARSTPRGHPGPNRGGTLNEGIFLDPGWLLPNFSGNLYAQLVQQTLFAPLFYSDDHGVMQPGLAARVPTVRNGGISADGRTYTFTLRRGLRWSDGTAITARDVDFSWRLWTNRVVTPAAYSTLGFDRIGQTTISVDALSITFRLVEPYAPFLSDWTDTPGILPVHVLRLIDPHKLATSGFALLPNVNSGPFTLAEVRKGARITLVRNPDYYGARAGYPYLDSIVFEVIPQPARMLAALRAHTIDTAWLLPITTLGALGAMRGVRTLPLRDPNWEAALVNLRRPILQDVRVRQALEYGLDRAAMVRVGWHGLATLIGSDQPPSSAVYARDVTAYPYDPGKAGRLLDAAGWRMGADGFRRRGKQILSLTYSTAFNIPWRHLDEAQALSDYERLGIQLVIRNYPPAVFANSVLPSGNFDLAEIVANNALDPDDTAVFGTRFMPPEGTNYGAYSNPEFDRLAGAEILTVDPVRRNTIFHQMQQLLHDDLPALWLYSPDDLAAASTRVHNYQPGPYSLDTWNAWEWWVDAPAKH